MYWLWSILFLHQAKAKTALLALASCFTIEFLQLYQADWILAIRASRLGALILGSGFLVMDLVWYFFGVGLAFLLDRALVQSGNERP